MTDKTTLTCSSQNIGFSLSTQDPNRPPQTPPGPGKPPVKPPGPDKPPVMSDAATANTSVAPTDMAVVELYCCPADTGIEALPVHVLSVARHS